MSQPRDPASHDVLGLFQRDAEELIKARRDALASHAERNIREAGDEVEIPAREVLGKRLRHSGHVSHGHAVDSAWRVSPQLDFILSDPSLFPVWNVMKSGAEHILFDTVRAVGEIKSSFYGSQDTSVIHDFCNTIRTLKQSMEREPSSLSDKFGFSTGGLIAVTNPDPMPYYNPLFCFMLIVSGERFSFEKVEDLYRRSADADLPNVVCILDQGVILKGAIQDDMIRKALPIPEFDTQQFVEGHKTGANGPVGWCFAQPVDEKTRAGACLLMLYGLLVEHLRRTWCRPSRADLLRSVPTTRFEMLLS